MNTDDMVGTVAIVTGGSEGLGRAIARRFVGAGASVMICARTASHLEEAGEELRALAADGANIGVMVADVRSPSDVRGLVDATLAWNGRIDVLVNNAGVYGPMGAIEDVAWDEWVRAIEINLYGSVLMCRSVVPVMKRQRAGKIIQLSGGGATSPMPNLSAYAVSKAAVVRFAETLALELRDYGVDVNAIAPGALNTRMLDEVLAAGPERAGRAFYERAVSQQQSGGAGFSAGVELAHFLGSAGSNGISGKLISAQWDAWTDWPSFLEELRATDAYTLRRVTGRDRGLTWGDK